MFSQELGVLRKTLCPQLFAEDMVHHCDLADLWEHPTDYFCALRGNFDILIAESDHDQGAHRDDPPRVTKLPQPDNVGITDEDDGCRPCPEPAKRTAP
ncbi:hypothetical protein [Microbacterium sp. NPDC056234]|uniref:hypothetical protein n=1 Tax=Microbacterium sp. NPDC056234 TaxID=3345757 RepID=UPI0035DA5057